MSSPTVSLQNSGFAAQTAATVAVVSVPDAPPEMMKLPVGSVLPAVLIPAETPSELPIMQMSLPDGTELTTQIKTNHLLRVPTPVSIKILPFDAKKTMTVRIHFSAPLPDVKKAIKDLPSALKAEDVVSAASHKRTIPVRAFVLHSVPEQITALMNELEGPAEQDLPPLKPNQAVRLELSPRSEQTTAVPAEQSAVFTPQPTQQPVLSALQTTATPQPSETQTAFPPADTVSPQTPVLPAEIQQTLAATVKEKVPFPILPKTTAPIQISDVSSPVLPAFTLTTEAEASSPPSVQQNDAPPVVLAQPASVQTETVSVLPALQNDLPAHESASLPLTEQTQAPLPQPPEKTAEDIPARIPLKGVVFDFKERSAPLVITKAGVLALEEKIQLPHLTPVNVQITEIIEPPVFTLAAHTDRPVFQSIEETLNLMQKTDSAAFESLKNVLPQIGNKLPAQILSFINTVSQNVPAASFIGETNIAALQNLGEKGQALLKGIEKDFAASPKKVSDGRSAWKGWTIPFLSGTVVEPVSLYLQKPQEDGHRQKGTAAKPNAVRFILDLNLTQLGKLQMDGLAHRNERRFDLIVRHQNDLPSSFDDKIHFIFTQTLSALNYTGTIKIDHTDQFIGLAEQVEIEPKKGVWA